MTRLLRLFGLLAIVLVYALPVTAQDTGLISTSGSRPMVQPEGTYVFQHIPHSDIIFEGQIAPRIIIVDSIGRATRNVLNAAKSPSWGYQVSTSPMVRLRMFDQTSAPVRTPSYMPKGTFQLARFKNRSAATDVDSEEFNRGPVELWLLDTIPFGHHSNGQDGCLFESEVRDATGECVELVPTSEKTPNKKDGSFSTNYIEATMSYGRMHLDSIESTDAAAGDFVTRWEWRVGVGMQFNPEGFVGGAIDPELSDRYGPTRVLLSAMTARRDAGWCGRAAAEGRLQYITTPPPDVPDLITQIEGSCFPRPWGGTGFFLRFYHGQDYYNLGFAESITRLMFGVALQKDDFLSFRISSTGAP
jgi:hypothetical protein